MAEGQGGPRRVGKYELIEILGRGGMGEVWRARDTQLDRTVALKLLQSAGREDLARFRREAHATARLNHPNIAQLHEVGEDPPYIAMQLIEGAPIDKAPAGQPLAAIVHAARAVHAAHEQGILHRDLKPGNILVDRSGRGYVLDFGLAREVRADATAMTLTGQILGTPAFMAPEQARGEVHAIDRRTDVYGLGATLYGVLTGSGPHAGRTPYEAIQSAVEGEPLPCRQRVPSIPADLETIVMKALSKDPDRRYASAADLADDLERFRSGDVIRARPTSRFYRARKRVRKHAVAWSASLLGLLAVTALAVLVGIEAFRRARVERARPHVENGRRALEDAQLLTRTEEAGWDDVEARIRAAIEHLDSALSEDPDGEEARVLRGRAHLQAEDLDRAWNDLGQVASPDSRLDRARVLLRRHEREVGAPMPVYRRDQLVVILLPPETERSRELISSARHEIEAVRRDDPQLPALDGALRYLSGRLRDAEGVLSRALEADPFSVEALYYRALTRLGLVNVPGAIEDLDRLLRIRPIMAEAWVALSSAQLMRSAFARAVETAERALELREDYTEALRARADALRESGRTEEAVRGYDLALELDSENVPARLGRFYARESEPDAVEDLDAVIAGNPDLALPYVERANWRMRQGDLEAAEEDLNRALARAPRYRDALLLRSHVRIRLGRFDEAADDQIAGVLIAGRETWGYAMILSAADERAWSRALEEAAGARPDDPRAQLRLGWIRDQRAQPRDRGAYEEALALAQRVIDLDPACAAAWFLKGDALAELGEEEQEILDCYATAARLDASIAAQSFAQSGHYLAFYPYGRAEEAERWFRRALELEPYDSRSLFNSAVNLMWGNEPPDEEILDRLVRTTYFYLWSVAHDRIPRADRMLPEDPTRWERLLAVASKPVYLWIGRAELLKDREEWEAALACCDRADDMDASPRAHAERVSLRGVVLIRMARYDEAIAVLSQEGPAEDPDTEISRLVNLATAYRRAGRMSETLHILRNVGPRGLDVYIEQTVAKASLRQQSIRFSNPADRRRLAELLVGDGRWAEAIDVIEPVTREHASPAQRYSDLVLRGRIHREMGAFEAARNDFEKAVRFAPDRHVAWSDLGDAGLRLGQVDQAEEAYERAADIRPDWARPFGGLAQVALRRGDVESAREHFARFLRLEPLDRPTGLLDHLPNRDQLRAMYESLPEAETP